MNKQYDIFICHASEDKDSIARPLALELKGKGLSVWFDETAITIGDSIRAAIDEGLAKSRYGIVILSPAFFSKHKQWTSRELGALTATAKPILPILHNLRPHELTAYSPLLADIKAAQSSEGIPQIAAKIFSKVAMQSIFSSASFLIFSPAFLSDQITKLSAWHEGAKADFVTWGIKAVLPAGTKSITKSLQQTLLDRFCPLRAKRTLTDNGFCYEGDLEQVCTNSRRLYRFETGQNMCSLGIAYVGIDLQCHVEIRRELIPHLLWFLRFGRNAAVVLGADQISISMNLFAEAGPIWINCSTDDPIQHDERERNEVWTDKKEIHFDEIIKLGSHSESKDISDALILLLQRIYDDFVYRGPSQTVRIPIVDKVAIAGIVEDYLRRSASSRRT